MIGECGRWCSSSRASRWRATELPRAGARARPGAGRACGPAASAAPTSTSSTATCASRSCRWSLGHQIVGHGRGGGGGRRALRRRRAGRGPVARLDRRRVPLLPLGPREPLRAGALHRLHLDGGYAERAVADERYCFPIPEGYPDLQAAPLLCAGLIGYRSLRLCGDAERLGLLRLRRLGPHRLPGRGPPGPARVRAHPPGRRRDAGFALELGAAWAGDRRAAPRSPSPARRGRPSRSTRRSSSRPSASWSRWRCARWRRAGRSSAPAST